MPRPLHARAGAVISLLAVLFASGAPAFDVHAQSTTEPSRPNLVVVMTDDQTMESLRFMPRVRRRLAGQGVTFSNSFVSYPLCCPSRATALTGQYSHNHGVDFNYAPEGGWQSFAGATDTALPVALQAAGYTTAHFGKVMNEYGMVDRTEVPPGWDTWHALLDRPARNRYYGFTVNINGTTKAIPPTAENYNTDYFARQATRFIDGRGTSAEPYFLNLWLFGPHGEQGNGPTIPAERHVGRLAGVAMPRTPSLAETDLRDKPVHLRRSPLGERARRQARMRYRWRAEALLAVDEAVGDLTRALRRNGQLDNTVIVFTSDNGFFHGEHAIPRGKWHVYDESTRVPLIFRGPGVPAGVTRTAPVANIDLLPTLLAYARAEPLMVPDGRALQPLITGKQASFDRDLLITTGFGRARRWYTAIRTDNWLYVEHVQNEAGTEIFAEELYNLRRDPWQLNSLHADPDRQKLKAWLQDRLHRLRTCAGASCHSRAQLPASGDGGGEPVAESQALTSGPVDDPESYPEFFSIYDDEPVAAAAAADVADVDTAVTLTTSRQSVTGARRVTFTARVTHDGVRAPGVAVTLRRRINGTVPWTDMAVATTGADGKATFTHRVTSRSQWRAHVLEQTASPPARSVMRGVSVRPDLNPVVRWNARRSALLFSGTVDPSRWGHTVQLLRAKGDRWIRVSKTTLSRSSTFRFRVRASNVTPRYRIRMPQTATTLEARSATLRPPS